MAKKKKQSLYDTIINNEKIDYNNIAPVKTKTNNSSIYDSIVNYKPKENIFNAIPEPQQDDTKSKIQETASKSNFGIAGLGIKNIWEDGYNFGDVTKSLILGKDALNKTFNPTYLLADKAKNTYEKVSNDIKEGRGNEYIKGAKPVQNIKKRFENGYDFGDVTKSILDIDKLILGTSADVLANAAKGELQTAEGLVDTGRYIISDEAKLLGFDEYSKNVRERAKENTTGVIFGETDIYNRPKENGWLKQLDQYSAFGNQMDNIVQSVGQQGFRVGLQQAFQLGGASEGTIKALNNIEIFAGSYGTAKSDALMNGADNKTATIRGVISGTSEWISEHLDENPFLKTGSVTSKLKGGIVKGVEKTFKSEAMGKLAFSVISAESEGFEERLSNVLETLGNDIVNYIDADYTYGMTEGQGLDKNASGWTNVKKIWDDIKGAYTSEESKSSSEAAFWSTLITFGLSQSSTKINKNQAIQAVMKENGLTKEQATKLYDAVLEARKSEVINETTDYNDKYNIENQLADQLSKGVKEGNINLQEVNEGYKAKAQLMEKVKTGLVSSQGLDLVDSYKAYNPNATNEDITIMRELQAFGDKRNVNMRIDAVPFRGNDINSVYVTNGTNDEIIFNPKASKDEIIQKLAIHEMGHDIMHQKTDAGTDLLNNVLNQLKSKDNYENQRSKYEKAYKEYYKNDTAEEFNAKIDEEMVMDELGANLGTQEYINRLINEKPSTAQRIYNWVKEKLSNIGQSKETIEERKYWKSIADKFEKAYNEKKTATGEDKTAYALSQNALKDVSSVVTETREQAEKNTNQFVMLKDNTISGLVKNGIEDLPMLAKRGHVRENILTSDEAQKLGYSIKNKNFHGLGVKTYLEIIDSMDNPVAIYQYTNKGRYNDNNYIVLTPIELNGNKAIVPVEINNRPGLYNDISIDYNKIKSTYFKENNNYIQNMLDKGIIKEIFTGSNYQQISQIDNNISQNEQNVNYSLTSSKDSQGRNLTPQQQEYFKDVSPKLKDKDGNLKVYYHGGTSDYNVFDKSKIGSKYNGYSRSGRGFYFVDNIKDAEMWATEGKSQSNNAKIKEVYLNITNPFDANADYTETLSYLKEQYPNYIDDFYLSAGYRLINQINKWQDRLGFDSTDLLQKEGYDGVIGFDEVVAFEPNQIKNIDNLNPTSNEDIRYSLAPTGETSIEDKINQSFTMDEAKKMIDIAFKENQINDWRDDNEKYRNADEWLNDVGTDEVAMYIENGYSTIQNYLNPLYDRDNSYSEDYTIEDILEAYKNGTLTGDTKQQANRLDLTQTSDKIDTRFYSPQNIENIQEVYNIANERVNNNNRDDVYKARGQFVILAHNQENIDNLGLDRQELNKKLKSWAAYSNRALELSNRLNKDVDRNNQWAGLENSSIINTASISNEELSSLVKNIEGDSSEWQRHYITSTMLALDTHIDYKDLSFQFDANADLNEKNALGDYSKSTKTIRIGRGYQNTVAHEMGHYLDNKWAEDFGFLSNYDMTDNLNFESANLSDDAKQFAKNFKIFMDDLVKSATAESSNNVAYYQDRGEIFARFVGRFVEWTKNTASDGRFGYEDKFYKDNFTQRQYEEFVKLLQEKSMLDTTNQTYNKYSLNTNNEIAPVTKGTRTTMGELFPNNQIAPINENIDKLTKQIDKLSKQVETLQNKSEIAPTSNNKGYVETYNEQRYENEGYNPVTEQENEIYQNALMNDEGYLKSLDEQANLVENNDKLVKKITDDSSSMLNLMGKKQKTELEEVIRNAIENDYTTDEISNELNSRFSQQEYTIPLQEAIDAKKAIRNVAIKVSDGIKTDIADYGDFQKSNFNKINFSKNGVPVDVAYQTLNEIMPSYFPNDIINPTDQLLKISEVANMMDESTELIQLSQDEIDDVADYISNSILNDKYNTQVKNETSLQNAIRNNLTEEIAPTTIRTQESIDEYIDNRDIAPVRETKPFENRNQKTENKEKLNKMKADFQEKFVNRNYYVDEMAKATGNEDIKFAGDNLNNVAGESQFNIKQHQTDYNGNWVGKSVNEIFAPAKQSGLYEAFNDYLVQKSNIERHNVGKGSQVPLEISKQLVSQYENENPQFKTWANDVYKYFDNVLEEQVKSGLVTEDQYKNFRGENGIYRSYVPFYEGQIDENRYFDNEGKIKPVSTLKRSKGGASDVNQLLSVEDAMIRQTYAYKKAIRQNELYKEIVSSMEKYEDMMDLDTRTNPTDMEESLYVSPDGDKILNAYINGEKISAKISDELYNELMRTNENNIRQIEDNFSLVTKPLQKASNIRRNLLTTWNPTFLARNAIKDIQDAVINSKHTTDMLKNYFGTGEGKQSAIIELSKAQSTESQQFLALYGADNLYGNYENISNSKNLANKFARINELIELAPRFAEFKASLQNGESVQQAIYNAREVTTNFGRGGYITKALNRNGFTFLNANVQGLDKAIRNLTGQNGVKGVTSVVIKGAAFSVLPSILNHLLFGLGDDKDEEYEALPDYIKDNYYLIKLENGKFFRIPKGRITSVFGSLARRSIETIEGEENAFEGWGKNAWEQIGVGDLGGNNILSPIIQAKNNEAWYGGDIVPTRLQNKPAAEQTDSKIDALSNLIGETFDISPYKVHYVIDQYSGGIGDVLLPMITPETTSGAENPLEYLTAPVKDSFIVNSTDDNKYAGDFYNLKDKLEIQSNSEKASDGDIIKYKYMSEISKQMSELYKEKREVQADTTIGNKEKYKKVQAIQKEINALAKEGLDNYKNVKGTDNYSYVDDEEYYKNTEDKWTKVNETDSEFTSGLTTTEKDAYYKTKNKLYIVNEEYKNKVEKLNKKDPLRQQYALEKKQKTIQAIVNSGLDNYTKAMVYSKSYSTQEKMNNVVNAGYDVDEYITALYDIEEIRNKYSQKNGYTTEQRKKKTIAYINSLNIEIPQKAMLVREYYSSFRDYNEDIVHYVANLNLTYEEKVSILEGTGMQVNGNNVTWK